MAELKKSDTALFRNDEREHEEFIKKTNEDLHSKYQGQEGPQPGQIARQQTDSHVYKGQMMEQPKNGRADSEMFRQDERNHAEFIRRTNEDLHSKYGGQSGPRARPPQIQTSFPSTEGRDKKTDTRLFREDEANHSSVMKQIDADLTHLSEKDIRSRMNEQLKRTDTEASQQDERNRAAFLKRTSSDSERVVAKGAPQAIRKDADDLLFRKPEPKPSSWWNCCASQQLLAPHPKTRASDSLVSFFLIHGATPMSAADTWNRGMYQCEAWGEEAFGMRTFG